MRLSLRNRCLQRLRQALPLLRQVSLLLRQVKLLFLPSLLPSLLSAPSVAARTIPPSIAGGGVGLNQGKHEEPVQASQNRVGAITEKSDEPKQPENCTREVEISEVLENAMATMHTVQSDTCLGPTLTTEVKLEGVSVKALVDTGSPKSDESPAQWRKRVEQQLEPPGPRLKSYGGEKLNTVCQIKVSLSRGEHSAECIVQVQNGAPVDLLWVLMCIRV